MKLDRFPVDQSGRPSFTDDFGAPRSGGRTHEGTDIFARRGTPVYAVRDGIARNAVTPLSGNSVTLTAADGTRYFYAHLDAFGPHQGLVRAGDVLGFVGDTGNARGTPPHLHFQIAAKDGPPLNPFPFLVAAAESGSPVRAPVASAGFGWVGPLLLLWLLAQAFGGRR